MTNTSQKLRRKKFLLPFETPINGHPYFEELFPMNKLKFSGEL